MAELTSAYPTTGGLYFWAAKLGGPGWGWFTGWFNLIGQFAITAGLDYGLAVSVDVLLNAWFPAIPAKLGTILGIDPATQWLTLGIYAVMLTLHAVINIFGVRLVAFLNDVSVWVHILAVVLIGGGVAVAAVLLQQFGAPQFTAHVASAPLNSLQTIFTTDPKYNLSGFPTPYAFFLGLLMAQYCFTGYDASAHMTEETVGADTRAPRGIIMSVLVSAVAGYALLMGLLAAAPDLGQAAGFINPVLYILESRVGFTLGTLIFILAVLAQFFAGMSSVTTNARMIYAFSRDGAIPFSHFWHRLDRSRVPVNAIILSAVCAFVLAIPTVINFVAYTAITSITTIGLYIAYGIPILLRLFSKDFQPGPWSLGRWGKPLAVIAVIWIVLISILFMLPTISPITIVTFNYTPVVVLGALIILVICWMVNVRHWFKGPHAQGSMAQIHAIEAQVGESVLVDDEEDQKGDLVGVNTRGSLGHMLDTESGGLADLSGIVGAGGGE
jgi:amino acid transporter